MTEDRFLHQLEQALQGRLSPAEVQEIIADHAEFFTAGRADGNTDAEIAARLGDPALIAASLIAETKGPAASAPAKAATYNRIIAAAADLLLATLPFVWLSPRLALLSFFTPQYVPSFLASFWLTVRISNHAWIAAVRPLWSAGIILAGIWFFLVNPILLMVWRGQTIGKRLLGLRVVKHDGTPANVAQYLARELFGKLALNALCSMIWLPLAFLPTVASLVWNLLSPDGQTLWDAIAHTRVVEVAQSKRGN